MPVICLVTALGAEAAPLIRHFQLEPAPLAAAHAYTGERCRLVQTGLGKLAAASATAALLEAFPDTTGIVNVGLCGATDPVGTVCLAHSVRDAGSGRHWYPHLPARAIAPAMDTREVLTVDALDMSYRAGTVFDMEASGVAAAATRRLDTARVQFVKCVSDNPAQPADGFDKRQAGALIERTLPVLEWLMRRLAALTPTGITADEQAGIERLTLSLTHRVHHSVTETHALRRLLIRHLALSNGLPEEQHLAGCVNARTLHRQLRALVDDAGVRY